MLREAFWCLMLLFGGVGGLQLYLVLALDCGCVCNISSALVFMRFLSG